MTRRQGFWLPYLLLLVALSFAPGVRSVSEAVAPERAPDECTGFWGGCALDPDTVGWLAMWAYIAGLVVTVVVETFLQIGGPKSPRLGLIVAGVGVTVSACVATWVVAANDSAAITRSPMGWISRD